MPQYEEWQNNFKKSSEKNSPDKNSPDKKPSEDNTGENYLKFCLFLNVENAWKKKSIKVPNLIRF